jgi:hypothetical protein
MRPPTSLLEEPETDALGHRIEANHNERLFQPRSQITALWPSRAQPQQETRMLLRGR